MDKNIKSFYLNQKEEQVMKVLWGSDTPLSATEIANRIDSDWAKKSIQNIIRKLESKKAIEVAEITKIGKTYGRLFRPTISSDEYAVMQFNNFYKGDNEVPFILCALTGNKKKSSALAKELKELMEKYSKEYERQICFR